MSERNAPISRRRALALGAGVGVGVGVSVVGLADARVARAGGEPMPCGFVGHGSPRLVVDPIRGPELRAWGASLPAASGVVVLTPHWRARGLRIGHVGKGRALYSFPRALLRDLPEGIDYPSPDNTALANTVRDLLAPLEPVIDTERGGFDHTSWMPLHHLMPKADVPVVEIALPFAAEAELFALGRRLAPLRYEGVFILASGNATHNLASIDIGADAGAGAGAAGAASGAAGHDARAPVQPVPWAADFDAWLERTVTARDVKTLLDWRARAPRAWLAHPDDGGHLRVMLVALGAASLGDAGPQRVRFPVTGFEAPTLSKRCIELA